MIKSPVERLLAFGSSPAVVWRDQATSYSDLHQLVQKQLSFIREKNISSACVVALKGDFSPLVIATLLALFEHKVVVALLPARNQDVFELCEQAMADVLLEVEDNLVCCTKLDRVKPYHKFLGGLLLQSKAGFVIFSSGSSGKPKPILHSLERFLKKYAQGGKPFVTLSFLLLDHIAGIDTLFYILYSGGTLVAPEERSPHYICKLVEHAKVEVLPVSPSFLNLLWLSGDYENCDLSSVQIVTYGSEPMTQSNLDHVSVMFPNAAIKQKYGTSEFGSPASKSRGNNELWIRLNGKQFETKIVEGILFVKSETTMLGYLDDSEPKFVDGWYNTGDRVEQDGEWLKILGRNSDMINVGGEKVFPSEVEAVIQQLDDVVECSVFGEPNPITGNMVCATILPKVDIDKKALKKQIKKHCIANLSRYKVPAKITFSAESLTNDRQKKIRRPQQ
ncbi:MAG: fatty acid--CoA ligase family protein [Chloroflexota bacterium]